MHLILAFLLLGAAAWKGDWRNWRKYSLTMAYVIICNLLYNLLCWDHLLWEHKADFLPDKHVIVDMLYTFITLPAVTLLFLSHYPYQKPASKQFTYIVYWVAGSMLVEYPFVRLGRLHLDNGYKYWMDFIFYSVMYSFLRLHFTRPLLVYGLSVPWILFLLWIFEVPIK